MPAGLKGPLPLCDNQAILIEAQFVLKGSLGELEHLAEETSRFCHAHRLGENVIYELNLALEELFVNTLRHGGCEGMEPAAQIRLQRNAASLLIEFSDRGRPFDPTAVPPPNLAAPLEERQKGGLGLHFVRYFMRNLSYHRDGQWNRLTMRQPLSKEEQ